MLLLSKRGSNRIGDEPKEQEMRVSSCRRYVFVYEIRISPKVGNEVRGAGGAGGGEG